MIIVRVALLCHLCFSIWDYTTQDIWATKIYFTGANEAYTKEEPVYMRLITDNGLPLTIVLGVSLISIALEYTLIDSICYCRKRAWRFKISKMEKRAPNFADVKERLKTYGDHTYDMYTNIKYKEVLLAIEDTGVWNENWVEKFDEHKPFELLSN